MEKAKVQEILEEEICLDNVRIEELESLLKYGNMSSAMNTFYESELATEYETLDYHQTLLSYLGEEN